MKALEICWKRACHQMDVALEPAGGPQAASIGEVELGPGGGEVLPGHQRSAQRVAVQCERAQVQEMPSPHGRQTAAGRVVLIVRPVTRAPQPYRDIVQHVPAAGQVDARKCLILAGPLGGIGTIQRPALRARWKRLLVLGTSGRHDTSQRHQRHDPSAPVPAHADCRSFTKGTNPHIGSSFTVWSYTASSFSLSKIISCRVWPTRSYSWVSSMASTGHASSHMPQ